jgi:non-homologous end joining protein Ku
VRFGSLYRACTHEAVQDRLASSRACRQSAADRRCAVFARTFRDRYEEALLAHLKAKQAGAVQERKQTFAAPRRVINLMEATRPRRFMSTGAASRRA